MSIFKRFDSVGFYDHKLKLSLNIPGFAAKIKPLLTIYKFKMSRSWRNLEILIFLCSIMTQESHKNKTE